MFYTLTRMYLGGGATPFLVIFIFKITGYIFV